MPNYPYDEIKAQIDREFVAGLNKNFDEVEQDVRALNDPLKEVLDGNFDGAALATEFETRAQAKLEEIQPEFYEFQTDTTAQLAQIAVNSKDFGSLGNANYLNPTDGEWYEDSSLVIKSNDDTAAINDAINHVSNNGGGIVTIYKKHLINTDSEKSGVQMKDNVSLVFYNNAAFNAQKSNSTHYNIINIHNVKNVSLFNPTIVGERNHHIGATGEWGHGISITNSDNIKIYNPDIKDCWGDGIYIGQLYWSGVKRQNNNILIEYPIVDNCRRNGISVCRGENIKIVNPICKNINGTSPESGIDIEPEGDEEFAISLDNVIITNPKTENCVGSGIMYFIDNLSEGEKSTIKVLNHHDDGSYRGFYIANTNTLKRAEGSLNILYPLWENNGIAGFFLDRYASKNTPKINIINPIVKNWNKVLDNNDYVNSAYSLTDSGISLPYTTGNIDIINPSAIDSSGSLLGYYLASTIVKPHNINIIDPLNFSGHGENSIWLEEGVFFRDSYEQVKNDRLFYEVSIYEPKIFNHNFVSKTTNETYDNLHTITLESAPENSLITFEIKQQTGLVNECTLRILPKPESAILPSSLGPINGKGKWLQSGTIGSKIVLKKTGENWFIVTQVGSWLIES